MIRVIVMNKILVILYIPIIEKKFDVLLPPSKKIYHVIQVLMKSINELAGKIYETDTFSNMPLLYDKLTAEPYDINLNVKDAGIKNGTEIILI